jgi:hypothetical protein
MIETIARELPGLLVGARTVLTVEQVKRAVSAGAKFIVSPGFNPKVVDYCVENGIPVTPGLTRFGLDVSYVSVIPDNAIRDCCGRELRKHGLDTSFIVRKGERLGIYFLETGAAQRPSGQNASQSIHLGRL